MSKCVRYDELVQWAAVEGAKECVLFHQLTGQAELYEQTKKNVLGSFYKLQLFKLWDEESEHYIISHCNPPTENTTQKPICHKECAAVSQRPNKVEIFHLKLLRSFVCKTFFEHFLVNE